MAVEHLPDEISAIRNLLSMHPEGLTIRALSAMLGMNRNSTAKYLDILQMQGGVTLKRSGPAKIYCLADKLPAGAVLKLTKSCVIIFDQSLTAAEINDPFTDFLRMAKTEILGKSLHLLPFAVQCQPELTQLIKEGIRGGESRTSALIRIEDRTVLGILTINPVFFENGNNGVSLTIDLPEEPNNGTMNGSFENDALSGMDVSEYICRFAPDGTLSYVNQAYSELLHKTKSELVGHIWRPTIPESEYKKIKKCLNSLDSAHPVASLEIRAITPGGDTQWQRWRFRLLPEGAGQPAGYQATGLDITEVKKLEQKAARIADEIDTLINDRKSEIQDLNKQIYEEIASHEKTHFQLQFTQFAMDQATYMITWISRDGRFVYMNREAQRVLGYQYRDVIAKKFPEIIAGFFPFPWDEIWDA
ncbi:MAG: PAS domain-containing protein, partial [Methanoregula sp.]|nr:PAS domain-containing protein [Methanoregula sp.]